MKKLITLALSALLVLTTSCQESGGGRARVKKLVGNTSVGGDGGAGAGQAASADDLESILNGVVVEGESEIRHIVDPFDGTYKTKLTLPKNFKGLLYLSGINITGLSNKVVRVRFRFGRELEPIVVDATIGRAPGITPQTDIDVLILDMNDAPFKDVRLLYDLYDYNDYRDVANAQTEDPVSDVRDGGLYCRGLKLAHDPTFEASGTNAACDAIGEKCLYSYAKVLDAGLYKIPTGGTVFVSTTPNRAQLDLTGAGYALQSTASLAGSCLPEAVNLANFNGVFNTALPTLTYDSSIMIGGVDHRYRGPYRLISESSWQISAGALLSPVGAGVPPTGLFEFVAGAAPNLMYYRSFLFPRTGKMELRAGVGHFGSTDPFPAVRTLDSILTAGEGNWMDGCNLRVTNYDVNTNEGIGSCNVTATIDLLYLDDNGVEQEIKNTDTTVKNRVKLQLTRPSLTNFEGKEVLYSSMKTCSTSNGCGVEECCYNTRCWSKSLVSSCLEDAQATGNLPVGLSCASDFECSSLCCSSASSTCQPHMNTAQDEVLCSKIPGQQCVSTEYCRKENIQKCFIVKTGLSSTGTQECALRCYNVPTFGDCRNGVCTPPLPPTPPSFDPSNPDCSGAVDPPTS